MVSTNIINSYAAGAALQYTYIHTRIIMKFLRTTVGLLTKVGKTMSAYAEAAGRARAAAELSRAGYHKEARDIMLK